MRVRAILAALVLLATATLLWVPRAAADSASEVRQLREEMQRLRAENERNRQRMEDLERKLETIQVQEEKKQDALEAKVTQEVEKQAASAPRRYLDRYFGDGRFVLTGWGAGAYEWQRNANSNTFTATLAPIFLYRMADWILFEAEPEFELKDDGDTEVNLEYAQADIVLNDYVTAVGGKFLVPFGQFIEQLHPAWINKMVSAPLPFREPEEGGLLPYSNTGFQLRGGARIGDWEGLNLAYSAYIANGPRFDSDEVGALLNPNNIDNNRGKGYGARLALYPLPLDNPIGRVMFGASTFDGKWDDGGNFWFTSWGLDLTYQVAELEVRAEYIRTKREMPSDVGADDREGWYVQAAYKLARIAVPYLDRLELVGRYAGVNQRAVTDEELVPHPRQVALGLDYWFTPSVAWKLEYVRDLPEDAPNDDAIRTQIAVGF